MFTGFYKEECGQGMAEYGLLVSLISIAAVAVVRLIGPKVSSWIQVAVDSFETSE
ncbi:MAG: Flp family type IVb pilin [Erysipelotrichaceae bacterium]|nr:Flp family type IVb pilin [Erysipelotrichaceae bacterium]